MKPKALTPRCVVVSPRGRGRPRLTPEPLTSVSTRLPVKTHDQLIEIAQQQDKSVSEVLRQVIIFNVVNIYQR